MVGAVKRDFRIIPDFRIISSATISPQMKILNMVIPILMHFCGSVNILALQAAYSHMSSNEIGRN